MSEHSRRSFIKRASITGAAAGAATIIPIATADADAQVPVSGPAHDGAFAVWVNDAKSGQISVFVGEREVVHHDKALARKLAQLAARDA